MTATPPSSSSKQHSHSIQNLYTRATRAELARDLDTAFRLYVEAGSAFLNVSRTTAHARTQEQARQDAARALERAELIKGVKPDVAPVWRDPFALGSWLIRAARLNQVDRYSARNYRGTAACIEKGVCDQWGRGSTVDDCFSGAGRGGDVIQVTLVSASLAAG